MADTMQFDLVSPEQRLASMQVLSVLLPGAEGDLTAAPGHAPTVTTLRPGLITVNAVDETLVFAVTGGFAEIHNGQTTVLAEQAFTKGPEANAELEELLEKARAEAEAARGPQKDMAEKLIYDFVHLLEAMQ